MRWNHVFSRKLFANTTVLYNDYKFSFSAKQDNFDVTLNSGIRDIGVKSDIDFYASTKHKLKFGGQYTFHRFTPSVVTGQQDTVVFEPNNAQAKFAHEIGVYVQDDWDISDKIKVNAGLRFSGFQQIGAYTAYERDADGNKLIVQFMAGGRKCRTMVDWNQDSPFVMPSMINPQSKVPLAGTCSIYTLYPIRVLHCLRMFGYRVPFA